MKKNTTIKTLILIVSIIFSSAFSFTAKATDDKSERKSVSEITFMGLEKDLPVYRLSINNNQAENFRVRIVDFSGNTLYVEKINGRNIQRNYKFDQAFSESFTEITFIVENLSTRKREIYKTNKVQTVVEKVEVKKVL